MRKKAGLIILFMGLLLLMFSCRKSVAETKAYLSNAFVDSLEREIIDSIYTNNEYVRSLLRDKMEQADDSVTYYQLLTLYGKACFAISDFDSVLYYNRNIVRFCRHTSTSPRIHEILSTAYNLIGNVWIQRTQPDSAIVYYQKAYEHRLQGDNLTPLPDLCMNMADASIHQGNYANATSYYRRALFLCDSLTLPEHSKYSIYYGLGQTYMELRDFELSDHYYELAESFFPQMNTVDKWAFLNNRGNHFYYKKDYPKALYYMKCALEVVKPYRDLVFQHRFSQTNLGELYMLSGKLDSAQIYLNDGYRYFSQVHNPSAVYYIETQFIELALKQGDIARAQKMISRTDSGTHIDANMINIRNQYLQHYYVRTGDYKQAYEYLQRDMKLNDSIRNEQVRTRVAELDMRYRQDTIVMRRELFIEKQSSEMKVLRLQNSIWGLGCGVLVVVSLLIYWLMKKKRFFLQERHLNQVNRLRMENVRNHISPHFTLNVLNREISLFKGSAQERDGLVKLVSLLRKSLELTEKLSVPLRDELDFVQTYVDLERSKVGEDFTFSIEIAEGVDALRVIIPSMIIQIPVENALKHGLTGVEGKKNLHVSAVCEETGVRIKIIDNGRGYFPHRQPSASSTGTGLKVLYQTIQLLNTRNRGGKILFEITNLAGGQHTGTCVSVFVPCNYSYDL